MLAREERRLGIGSEEGTAGSERGGTSRAPYPVVSAPAVGPRRMQGRLRSASEAEAHPRISAPMACATVKLRGSGPSPRKRSPSSSPPAPPRPPAQGTSTDRPEHLILPPPPRPADLLFLALPPAPLLSRTPWTPPTPRGHNSPSAKCHYIPDLEGHPKHLLQARKPLLGALFQGRGGSLCAGDGGGDGQEGLQGRRATVSTACARVVGPRGERSDGEARERTR